jgi:hypothetical protein
VIIETILSSNSKEGKANFAPVGVHITDDYAGLADVKHFDLRLYPGSNTFANLKERNEGVINFSDDIRAFVDTAFFSDLPLSVPSHSVRPPTMADAKAVWEFSVTSFDSSTVPTHVKCNVLLYKQIGSFGGFCRAQGAILEAVIAATRLQWIPANTIPEAWPGWREIVSKTGGRRELEAFRKLTEYLLRHDVPIPAAALKQRQV